MSFSQPQTLEEEVMAIAARSSLPLNFEIFMLLDPSFIHLIDIYASSLLTRLNCRMLFNIDQAFHKMMDHL